MKLYDFGAHPIIQAAMQEYACYNVISNFPALLDTLQDLFKEMERLRAIEDAAQLVT